MQEFFGQRTTFKNHRFKIETQIEAEIRHNQTKNLWKFASALMIAPFPILIPLFAFALPFNSANALSNVHSQSCIMIIENIMQINDSTSHQVHLQNVIFDNKSNKISEIVFGVKFIFHKSFQLCFYCNCTSFPRFLSLTRRCFFDKVNVNTSFAHVTVRI